MNQETPTPDQLQSELQFVQAKLAATQQRFFSLTDEVASLYAHLHILQQKMQQPQPVETPLPEIRQEVLPE